MTGSKLHKGSVIYDATTGTEQGAILHDGTYTSTDTPASTDTLLIKQSGVQKQITHKDLMNGFVKLKSNATSFRIGGVTAPFTNDVIWENGKTYQFIVLNSENGFQEDAMFGFDIVAYSYSSNQKNTQYPYSFLISPDDNSGNTGVAMSFIGDANPTFDESFQDFDDTQVLVSSSYGFDIYMRVV